MILTFVNNHKLFIQFDRIVKKGLIYINDDKQFDEHKEINNSEFEMLELPDKIGKINIRIEIDGLKILRTINIE